MNKRNTIQREMILRTVRNIKSHVTADDVYKLINSEYPNMGKGTVYRNLKILAEEGKIRKVEIPDGPDRFDFTTEEHYHVRCVRCSEVSDVDMDIVADLKKSIRDTHGIQFLNYDILFKGICPSCQQKEKE